jgi:hypothetical protein
VTATDESLSYGEADESRSAFTSFISVLCGWKEGDIPKYENFHDDGLWSRNKRGLRSL